MAKTKKKPEAKKKAKPEAPKKAAKRVGPTATENGPRGAGIWDKLEKPPSVPYTQRMIAAAVMRNEQVSARANFQEQRKHIKGLLEEEQAGKEYDKLAGKLLHIEDDIRRTKTTEKAAVETVLKLALELVGGDLFQIAEELDGEKPAKDLPGQLKIGEADLSPDEAGGPALAVGTRYHFVATSPLTKPAKMSGTVVGFNARTRDIRVQPDEGNGGIFEMSRGMDNYTWEEAKDAG